MKKILLATAIFGVMASPAFADAGAGSGTITFEGSIIEAACGIDPDSVNQTINLGQIATKTLADGGTSTPVPFTIELIDCTVGDTTTGATNFAKVTFTGGVVDDSNPTLLALQGKAAGAGIAISGLQGKPVEFNNATTNQQIQFQNGDNTLLFSAYLQGLGGSTAITPGDFTAVTNFTMSYE